MVDLRTTRMGEVGPLVVLLHGYGGGPLEYRNVAADLGRDHRILIPNLAPLFSSFKPISYSQQIERIAASLNEQNPQAEPFYLVGSSYGGTLSWALRTHYHGMISGHVLINPMPLDPLPHLQSAPLRMLFGMNMVPGALPLFLRTSPGQKLLIELAEVFGINVVGTHSRNISPRKLDLVTKAVQRFSWIVKNESWDVWKQPQREILIPTLIIGSNSDPLFSEKEFRAYQTVSAMTEYMTLESGGHMAVKSQPAVLADKIRAFIRDLGDDRQPPGSHSKIAV